MFVLVKSVCCHWLPSTTSLRGCSQSVAAMDVGAAASAAAADVPTQKEKLPMKIAKPMKAAGKATSMKTMKSSMKAKKRAKDKTVKVVASHRAKPSTAMKKAKKTKEEGKPPN